MANQAKGPDGLTPKQRRFVQELPLANSGLEAVTKAGYDLSASSDPQNMAAHIASENVRKPAIAAALQARIAAIDAPSIATQIERKELLTASLRGVLPPAERPELTPELRLKASDQLNRMERIYASETPGTTINDNRTQVLMAYSVEQLEALLVAMKKGVIVDDNNAT